MRRGRMIVMQLAGAIVMVALLAGCRPSTREKVLATFFDGVTQTPPPPTRRVRRDLLREVEELKQQLQQSREETANARQESARSAEAPQAAEPARPIEQVHTWEEAAKLLPATEDAPDWSKALAKGLIAPRPGPDPQAPRQPIMPLDVELVPASDPAYKVLFRHESHTSWLSCANCHPGIFQMKRGADEITMDKINAGQYCGVCHGKAAFPLDACARCHSSLSGGQ